MKSLQGKFGNLSVRDTAYARELLIDDQVQGGSFLEPSAATIDSSLVGPGPIATSAYQAGWFLAGADYPQGEGIMIGLGSGSGAIQLLYNFPGIILTVIEIDPVLVQLARNSFPLIGYYEDQGRLLVIEQDANVFLANPGRTWEFGLADAYNGEDQLVDTYIPTLAKAVENLYINVIDYYNGPGFRNIFGALADTTQSIKQIFKAIPCTSQNWPFHATSNWIFTTTVGSEARDQFIPFQDLDSHSAAVQQANYELLLRHQLDLE